MGVWMHLLLIWLVALSKVALADEGNLSETCTDIELSGKYSIIATCFASPNRYFKNQLDLNLCVGLDHTSNDLQWSVYGKLSIYCSNCTLATDRSGSTLSCNCKSTGSASPAVVSSLQLDEGIKNVNGTLTCLGGKANVGFVN